MNQKERMFIETVWEYYKLHGRQSLPWRKTKNPYRIVVSEIMLQQTQVERVVPRYTDFLKEFPSVAVLAQASLGDVLKLWQGLGYNRRAKMLHDCAKEVTGTFRGAFPRTHQALIALPGIGPYTAGALMAFSYNKAVPMIETNIRTVYLHHFFKTKTDVDDLTIIKLIEKTLDKENPREWYWALMDYGSCLKKEFGNQNSKSSHYTKQSQFKDSDRQIRGAIVRLLTEKGYQKISLHKKLSMFESVRIDVQLKKLTKEKMIIIKSSTYQLP